MSYAPMLAAQPYQPHGRKTAVRGRGYNQDELEIDGALGKLARDEPQGHQQIGAHRRSREFDRTSPRTPPSATATTIPSL
jgi:hypothetical protein